MEKNEVFKVYNKVGDWFYANRPRDLIEKKYLQELIRLLPEQAEILDLGCGTGEPIFRYLIEQGIKVIGFDASEKMLSIAKTTFPGQQFILGDMRSLHLDQKFDAIIAWHSFFHLPAEDQPQMFELFKQHLMPKGILIFTSGTKHGEAWGMIEGENLFHASLDTEMYRQLLETNSFKILQHVVEDPDCGFATVWMAQNHPI